MTTETATSVTIQNVIDLINSSTMLVGILAVGFTLVGVIAVWRTEKDGAWAFFRMFERMQILQLLTVMFVVASATVLALLGILNSNGVTGILSGVAGYVLGGLNHPTAPSKSEPKQSPQSANDEAKS